MDEIDISIQVELNVHIEIHQWDTRSAIEELHKVTDKQPFPFLARVILDSSYKGLGKRGDKLKPSEFNKCLQSITSKLSDTLKAYTVTSQNK